MCAMCMRILPGEIRDQLQRKGLQGVMEGVLCPVTAKAVAALRTPDIIVHMLPWRDALMSFFMDY